MRSDYHIPQKNADLRRYVVRRDLRRTVGFLLIFALWMSGAVFYNLDHQTYPPARRMLGWKLAVWIFVGLLLGLALSRLWKTLLDLPYHGTILSFSVVRSTGDAETGVSLYKKIRVRTENGKIRTDTFPLRENFYAFYAQGDEILKLHGLPYPLNRDTHKGVICGRCGTVCPAPTVCPVCGFSVIDPAEVMRTVRREPDI